MRKTISANNFLLFIHKRAGVSGRTFKVPLLSRKYRDLNSNVCFGAQNNCLVETVLLSTPNLFYKLYLVRTLCVLILFSLHNFSHLLHI